MNAASGYSALREHAAWIDLSARGKIRVSGEDRARLLHAMTTNHVEGLKPGEGCYTFFLNAQGRILGDANLLCFDDHILIDTEPETRQKLYEHLDRYIIADDATLEDATDRIVTIAIEGPEAAEVLAKLGAPPVMAGGSTSYAPALVGAMLYVVVSVAWYWVAFFAFGPGLPNSSMIPSERRLCTDCPLPGRNVAKR